MSRILAFTFALVLALTCTAAVADEEKTPDQLVQEYQAARLKGTNTRLKQWYDPSIFDLSDLPVYNPEFEVSGTIRQWGSNYIQDSGLVQVWESEFKQWHPDVVFEDTLTSSANAFPGLITGLADIGQMGREAMYDELNGFQRQCALGYAMAISTCFGSYEVRGWTFSLAVFVNSENPLDSLTMQQVDGIFGAARTGGWEGLTWSTEYARGAEDNIRTWGQLGLTGEWADAKIQPYGYTLSYHFPDEFEKKVFHGGQRWNEDMIEVANHIDESTGLIVNGGTYITDCVAADKFAIGYCGAPFMRDGVKMLALAADANSPAYENNYANIHNATYPLTRKIYAYSNPLQALNPVVTEFYKYMTSQQGQERIAWDAKYVPMDAKTCNEQWQILEDSKQKAIEYFKASKTKLTVNNAELTATIPAADFIGTMMVPVQDVVSALGGTCAYDQYALTVTLNGHTYVIRHGNVKVDVDGETVRMTQPAFMVEDTMMAPVELFSSLLNVNMTYDSAADTVAVAM